MLPRVVARDGSIELGEHAPGNYSTLKRLPVEGMLTPADDGSPAYVVGLTEFRRARGGGPLRAGFVLSGRFTDDTISLVMENFDLADWQAANIPTPHRRLFETLGLEGTFTRLTFDYDPKDRKGGRATLEFADAEINLPIPTEATPEAGGKLMRMRSVAGSAAFQSDQLLVNVRGMLEDLPYTVTLLYQGMTADAPFTCEFVSEGFLVEKLPRLLPYAPPIVREQLADFSGPTATVNTRLLVSRGEPTPAGPAEVEFKGWMDVSNGRAAFHRFPYEFHDLSGRVYFDNHRVEISDVRGVSDSGAVLTARGAIAPPNDSARLDIHVDVKGAPVDDRLRKAIDRGAGHGRALNALLSNQRYERLLASGLVLTPKAAEELRTRADEVRRALRTATEAEAPTRRAELDAIEDQLDRPVFEFGASADVSVHVHRPFGDVVDWETTIEIRLPKIGLLPEAFPVPIHARDVVCIVRDQDATLVAGRYFGLNGGSGTVAATFTLPDRRHPDADPRPDVTIDLQGVPFDELVIQALPGPDDGPGAIKRILRELRIDGVGEGRVHIAPLDTLGRAPPDADAGRRNRTGFDADLRIVRAEASPGPVTPSGEKAPPSLTGVTGTVQVTERSLLLKAAGQTAGEHGGAAVTIDTAASFEFRTAEAPDEGGEPARAPARPDVDTTVRVAAADLLFPVEPVVAVFSPKAAAELAALRRKHSPTGAADVAARVSIRDGVTRSVLVGFAEARDVEFDWLGGRVAAPQSTGQVEVECIGGVLGRFDRLAAPMQFDAAPVGDVVLDGWYRFLAPPPGATPPGPADRVLRVTAQQGRFESPFVTAVLAAPLGRDRLKAYEALKPAGEFTAELAIRGGGGEPLNVGGLIEPRSFRFEIDGVPVSFESITGSMQFGGGEGSFHRLAGRAEEWSFLVDGSWRAQPEGRPADGGPPPRKGVLLDLAITAQGSRLTPDARVILPRALREALEGIKLQVHGPFAISDARLTLMTGVPTEQAWTRFNGTVGFEGISLEAGAKVEECNGRFTARFERTADGPPIFRIAVLADALRIAGATASQTRVVVQNGDAVGAVVLPMLTGVCHSGRFSGRVRVAPAASGEREYTASFQLAGVDFGGLLYELSNKADKKPSPPGSRGQLDAELTIGGFVNAPETRRGRGSFRVTGKDVRVLNLPGILPLIEVSNLQLPANDSLDYAEAAFFIDAGLVSFERLAVYSRAIEISGFGTMSWPQTELDLRLSSRSARPIPVVSWLFQGIRNQLVGTQVRGTVREPKVRLVTMPTTRRMLGPVVGQAETERSRRLLELERRAGRSRHGIRPSAAGLRGASVSMPGELP